MTDLKTLYEEDTVAWAENQATALRAAAQGGSNQELDWNNLAEEIEDLATSQRLALRSQISRVMQHHVKLAHSSATDPRRGWRRSIRQARVEIERILEGSPSLKREVRQLIADETRRSANLAIAELEDYGELPVSEVATLKAAVYLELAIYTEEQILGDWFPPEPKS